MALTVPDLLPILLRKSDAQIEEICADAEQIVLGAMTSISALSQSTAFDRDDAAVILRACGEALRLRKADPSADPSSIGPPAIAHDLRRCRQVLLGP